MRLQERAKMAQPTASSRKLIPPHILQRGGVALLLSIMLVLAGSLMVGFVQRAWQEHQLNRAIAEQFAQNEQQRAKNLQLKGAADFSESDVAVEQAARERLGMAREGEMVLLPTIILPQAPTAGPTTLASKAASPSEASREADASEPNVVGWMHALFPGRDALP
jgi:cell division protein FtsB